MDSRKKRVLAVLGIAAMLFAASVGVTQAFLTSMPAAVLNKVTPGALRVKLEETKWNPLKAKELVPGSCVDKDPTAVNTGSSEEWVFMKVTVPKKEIVEVDEHTKRKQERKNMQLFEFAASEEWELIEKDEKKNAAELIYGYRSILKPGEKSVPLFTQVKLVNYLEGELDIQEGLEIPVDVMSIQSNVCTPDTPLKRIYELYLKQKDEDRKEQQ